MADTKTTVRHVHERTISAEIEDVWRALTDPDERQQGHYDNVVESTWMPGEPVSWRNADDEVVIEGTVVDVDAPHRLVHTFAYTEHAKVDAANDAPSRVTWSMEPDDEGTRVMLVHDEFGSKNATWRVAEDGWEQLLDGLAQLFEDPED